MSGTSCTTLLEALHDKYSFNEDDFAHIRVSRTVPRKSESGELVVPRQLSLNGTSVSSAGDHRELAVVCANVCELDLMENQLSDWQKIKEILECMPKLTFLNLGNNPLGQNQEDYTTRDILNEIHFETAVQKVTKLALNSTHLSWRSVASLLKCMPQLEELHLSLNDYSSVDITHIEPHHNLKSLFLNFNQLTDWKNLCSLSDVFPALQQLVVIGNPIRHFDDVDLSQTFQHLRNLNLSKTHLSRFEELTQFNKLRDLKELQVLETPLLEGLGKTEGRQMCLAYLPKLSHLSKTPITELEREDAERAFIRKFMDVEGKPDRYFELEKKHGKLEKLVEVDMSAENTVSVIVHHGSKSKLFVLPVQMTLKQLKKKMEAFAGIPSKDMVVYHHDIVAAHKRTFQTKYGGCLYCDRCYSANRGDHEQKRRTTFQFPWSSGKTIPITSLTKNTNDVDATDKTSAVHVDATDKTSAAHVDATNEREPDTVDESVDDTKTPPTNSEEEQDTLDEWRGDYCQRCKKKVMPSGRGVAGGYAYHKDCLRCIVCYSKLNNDNIMEPLKIHPKDEKNYFDTKLLKNLNGTLESLKVKEEDRLFIDKI